MKKFTFLFIIMLFALINIYFQSNLATEKSTTQHIKEKTSTILLGGYNPKEKSIQFQTYDVSDKTNPNPKNQFSIKSENEKFKYVYPIAYIGKYVCFQGMNKFYHRREKNDKPEYSLILYKVGEENKDKPIFEEKYKGYPGTAFHVIDNNLFIGCNNEVRLATIKDDKISVKSLYNIDENIEGWNFHNKTIDAFVEYGDNKLLAIDDVIAPFFGFIFDIKDPLQSKYVKTIDLPTYVNLHYEDAVSDKDTIYALGYYGHMGGSGFLIYALKFKDDKLYIKYIYRITKEDDIDEEIENKYWDYPLLTRRIYLAGDKILLIGVDGLIELSTKPESTKSDKEKLLSVENYNDWSFSNPKNIYIDANDKVKLHKFDGIISSIEVKDNIIYALLVKTQQPQTKPKSDENTIPERTCKLLVLKYNDKDELETIKTIDVDSKLTGILD